MRKIFARLVVAGAATFLIGAEPALSQESPLNTIERTMRRIDRNLCQSFTPERCRRSVRKTVQKPQAKRPLAETRVETDKAKTAANPVVQAEEAKAGKSPPPIPHARPATVEQPADPAVATATKTSLPAITSRKASQTVSGKDQDVLSEMSKIVAKDSMAKKDQARLTPPVAQVSQTAAKSSKPSNVPAAAAKSPSTETKMATIVQPEQQPDSTKKEPTPISEADGSECLKTLSHIGTTFVPVDQPSDKPQCHVDNPVRLVSVDVDGGKIKLADQPILRCSFAIRFAGWIQTKAVPITQSEMGTPLQRISTGPGFDCRGRNGDATAKLSEHATGNAVDIEGFRLGDGSTIHVKEALDTKGKGFDLLKQLRASACKDFTTVLGPGANAAHEEHFHFDLEKRKVAGTYQICQ